MADRNKRSGHTLHEVRRAVETTDAQLPAEMAAVRAQAEQALARADEAVERVTALAAALTAADERTQRSLSRLTAECAVLRRAIERLGSGAELLDLSEIRHTDLADDSAELRRQLEQLQHDQARLEAALRIAVRRSWGWTRRTANALHDARWALLGRKPTPLPDLLRDPYAPFVPQPLPPSTGDALWWPRLLAIVVLAVLASAVFAILRWQRMPPAPDSSIAWQAGAPAATAGNVPAPTMATEALDLAAPSNPQAPSAAGEPAADTAPAVVAAAPDDSVQPPDTTAHDTANAPLAAAAVDAAAEPDTAVQPEPTQPAAAEPGAEIAPVAGAGAAIPAEPVAAPAAAADATMIVALEPVGATACIIMPKEHRICVLRRSDSEVRQEVCYAATLPHLAPWPRWLVASEVSPQGMRLMDDRRQRRLQITPEQHARRNDILELAPHDLAELAAHVSAWRTVWIVADDAPGTPDTANVAAGVRAVLEQWRLAWEHHAFEDYVSHYGAAFTPQYEANVESWRARKRRLFQSDGAVAVQIGTPSVFALGASSLVTTFEQFYRSKVSASRTLKVIRWQRENDRWMIATETALLDERSNRTARPPQARRHQRTASAGVPRQRTVNQRAATALPSIARTTS